MLIVLPRVSPFVVTRCTGAPATACFSGINPLYPVAFIVSILGMVVTLFGAFGGRFVVSPLSVAGTVALEYGLAATVSALLDTAGGVAANPLSFTPLVAVGAFALCFQAYRRSRRPAG